MGGRGGDVHPVIPEGDDPFKWLKEVPDARLKNYISRSAMVGDQKDPQGRRIHDVAYQAKIELRRRNK